MPEPRFKLCAAVYLLLIQDRKVLLLRRYNTGWSDGQYSLVAGHLDGQESLRQAVCREAHEEAGITIRPQDVRFAHSMHHKSDNEYAVFFFTADTWQGEPHNTEPDKCDDMQWFDLDKLPDTIQPHVRHAISAYEQGISYSEYGW